ncbi:MAG: FkbM family methyltransferase [Verrucomicrobiales bacterium]|nr:FkbM family methyltransferase [Verrucomicrobiales bacterium]
MSQFFNASLKCFSTAGKIRVLLGSLIRKLIGSKTERLLLLRFFIYNVLKTGGQVKVENSLIKVSLTPEGFKSPILFLLRQHSTDGVIFSEILLHRGGDYRILIEIAQRFHIHISTIVDAGANIGAATVYFGEAFRGAAILSIEPEEANFSILQQNIALNGNKNTEAIKRAFWINNETLNIGTGIRGTRERELSFSIVQEETSNKVQGFTFKDCLAHFNSQHIDLLKIDIEGAEKSLVQDEAGFAFLLDHIKMLAIELHHEAINPLDFIAIIEKAGFSHFQHGEITVCWKRN